jgi:hypothetical protein
MQNPIILVKIGCTGNTQARALADADNGRVRVPFPDGRSLPLPYFSVKFSGKKGADAVQALTSDDSHSLFIYYLPKKERKKKIPSPLATALPRIGSLSARSSRHGD